MRLKQHPSLSLTIENLDSLCCYQRSEEQCRHGKLLPHTVRAIIAGPSGCGKTNLLLSLLFGEHGLRFENIYIFSKTLYQPKYEFLNNIIKKIPEIQIFNYANNEEIIDPENANINSIFIFDDIVCDKQDKIRSYFCMGRHKLIDTFYLSQTYVKVPKHLIRDNVNVIVLFKQDGINLKHAYDEHVNTDMRFDQFKEICSKCWEKSNHSPVVIMKDFKINEGRYRMGFDTYISINAD
jgi:hypothetical protein